MQVYLKIKDKETGMVSEPVPIEDVIFEREEVEFEFEDETSLPYNDFLFFRDDYEGIVVIKEEE